MFGGLFTSEPNAMIVLILTLKSRKLEETHSYSRKGGEEFSFPSLERKTAHEKYLNLYIYYCYLHYHHTYCFIVMFYVIMNDHHHHPVV